ncbi:hypothetical protein [Nitrobacter winogradskyi]|uniref:hypothetical protein n=1 Tax=Nitrobacter winogradskyi TaxID=913 RepID=UPI0002DEAA2C|nr:hypothetical protein [Nitrobacter winogradskyi]
MLYALFDRDRRIGEPASTELGAWENALRAGLVSDIPVADEQGGQVLPPGLRVRRVDKNSPSQPE